MKNTVVIILALFISLLGNAQTKKKSKSATVIKSEILAKSTNITVEFFKQNLYLINTKADKNTSKDTIVLKSGFLKNMPLNVKIEPINAKLFQFCVVSWTENELQETATKTENSTTIYSEVCDFSSKTKVFSNLQKTTNIKEIVSVGGNKDATQTVERSRKEGYQFSITPNGDIVQKNKKGDTKWFFNTTEKKYVYKK